MTIFETHFPLQPRKYNKRKYAIEPWYTKELLIYRRMKDKKYKLWKLKGNGESKAEYTKHKNAYNNLCKKVKKHYYEQELFKTRYSPQKNWKLIKEAAGMNKPNCSKIDEIVDGHGNKTSNPTLIANIFNDYFSNIGAKTVQSVDQSNSDFKKYLSSQQNSFYLNPMGPFMVMQILDQLKDKKTKDINDISIFFLKKIAFYIAEPLAHIYDLAIFDGIYPEAFKTSKTIPVYKRSGNRNCTNNYRPITIVNCFSKILEKYMADCIMNFLIEHNLLSEFQFGFVEGKNTFGCLFDIIGKISENSSNGLYSSMILLDISKAFDTCSHEIILEKLFSYGIRGRPLNLIRTFLLNRKQKVKVGEFWSACDKIINIGVPQGSVIGVLLFLIYINDLPTATTLYTCCYADDTDALASASSLQELEYQTNQGLTELMEWFKSNRLILNLKKTNLLVFSPNLSASPAIKLSYYDNGTEILINQIPNQKESSVRSLGILLDNRLTFKDHVLLIKQKINKSLFFISRMRNILPIRARKQLYYSYVHSHLIYCLPLFTFLKKTDLDLLCKLQRKAIRITYNVKYNAECRTLFHDLGIIPINMMLEKEILKIMNKVYIYREPKEISKYFIESRSEHPFQLRENIRFHIPMLKSTKLMKSPIFHYSQVFNNFENNIKTCSNIWDFNRELNKHFQKDIYDDNCQKKICRICDFDKYEKHLRSYISSTLRTYDYYRFLT